MGGESRPIPPPEVGVRTRVLLPSPPEVALSLVPRTSRPVVARRPPARLGHLARRRLY
jgi:hypothetical protein